MIDARTLLLLLSLWGLACNSPAQTTDPILREGEVTEAGIVGALKPPEDMPPNPCPPAVEEQGAGDRPAVKCRFPRVVPKVNLLITFETDSARLTDDARRSLDVVARALTTRELSALRFTIEGHADPRGDPASNQRLSEARAGAVRTYLVEKTGTAANRFKVVGMGSKEPLKPEHPAAPENRRVTIVTALD